MTLIPCPCCGREVSPNATSCPQCGEPLAAASAPDHRLTCPSCRLEFTSTKNETGSVACPRCRENITIDPPLSIRRAPSVQVIEKTSKSWKATQLAGVLLIIVGAAMSFLSTSAATPTFATIGVFGLTIGLPIYMIGRIGAWWHHG